MKKVLLFGKLNEITKDINHYLRDYFQVQLCSENVEIGIGMMKIYQPDAVIISLVGLYEAAHGSFFTDLYKNYRETPVIVIGTEKENNAFIPYWRGTQFSALSRPIDCGEIMQRLCEKIGLDMEQILREEEEKEKNPHHFAGIGGPGGDSCVCRVHVCHQSAGYDDEASLGSG